jgi:hypothetical protein
MRILNIIQCTDLGGMEHASLRLMQSLQDIIKSSRITKTSA